MSLYQDAAGTVPALLPGDPVGKIVRYAGTVDAIQATQASKPTLGRWPKGGVVNKIPWSVITGSGWSNINVTRIGNKIVPSTEVQGHLLASSNFPVTVASGVRRVDVIAKADGYNWMRLQFSGPVANTYAYFNLSDATFSSVAAGATAIATPLGDGWVHCTILATAEIAGGSSSISIYVWDQNSFTSFAGDGVSGILVNHASFIDGSGYRHQVKLGENDVTEAGVTPVWFLWNDGGDSMPVTLPAGDFGLAWVDALGAVTVTTVTSDGTTPINLLRATRMADVLIRQGSLSAVEVTELTVYWEGLYK